jgi:NADH-quinone oxidoreductase subunit L
VVTLPLVLLAVPSVYSGWAYIEPMLFGDYFGASIVVNPAHDSIAHMREEYHGIVPFIQHGLLSLPFWLAIAGIAAAWLFYIARPGLPGKVKETFGVIHAILERKYGFDEFNDWFFAGGARKVGWGLWRGGDVGVIDGFFVNGSAKVVRGFALIIRKFQSGFIYHYAFTMIIGVFVLLTLWSVLFGRS